MEILCQHCKGGKNGATRVENMPQKCLFVHLQRACRAGWNFDILADFTGINF